MIYIINNKPYVKVAHYFKEVEITKKGSEYSAKPIGGIETRIENPNMDKVMQMSVMDYYEKNNSNGKSKQNNSDLKISSLD